MVVGSCYLRDSQPKKKTAQPANRPTEVFQTLGQCKGVEMVDVKSVHFPTFFWVWEPNIDLTHMVLVLLKTTTVSIMEGNDTRDPETLIFFGKKPTK